MKHWFLTLMIAFCTISVFILFIIYPQETLEASLNGLNVWGKIIFPSLLPFFILSELLISFGVVRFIGVLFEPIMRPIFNIPGAGSFAWIIGMASGYPSGAKITAKLREEEQLNKIEAERIIAYSNNASPLFIFGAVAVGMFHDAQLGLLIAVCHYMGNMIIGFCMRFYGTKAESPKKITEKNFSLKQAFNQMHLTRIRDTRPFGTVLSDAVIQSIQTLLLIGGFIILFSVLSNLLIVIESTQIIVWTIAGILSALSISTEFSFSIFTGLFELSLGSYLIANEDAGSLLQKLILVSFLLGFNGFSVHAQVASILAKTDISFAPYFFARIMHGIIASILTIFLFSPMYLSKQGAKLETMPVSQEPVFSFFAFTLEKMMIYGTFITITAIGIASILYIQRTYK